MRDVSGVKSSIVKNKEREREPRLRSSLRMMHTASWAADLGYGRLRYVVGVLRVGQIFPAGRPSDDCERRNATRDVASSLRASIRTPEGFEGRGALQKNDGGAGDALKGWIRGMEWNFLWSWPLNYVVPSHVEEGSDTPPGSLGSTPHRRRGSEATRATRGGHYHKKTLRAPAPPPPAEPRPRRRARDVPRRRARDEATCVRMP